MDKVQRKINSVNMLGPFYRSKLKNALCGVHVRLSVDRPSVCLWTSIAGLSRNSDIKFFTELYVSRARAPDNLLADSHSLPKGVNKLRHVSYLLADLSTIQNKKIGTQFCSAGFFLRRGPQQMLRTHRSLKAYCASLWWRWLVFFLHFSV